MTYLRHESLFTLQELFEMDQKDRFELIFTSIDITPALVAMRKSTRRGRPEVINYRAMIYSLMAQIVERIPFVSDLVKRLKNDLAFRWYCGFSLNDRIPSESSYTRLVNVLSQSNLLSILFNGLIGSAIEEGFIVDDAIAIDATHVEARDQAPQKETKPAKEPKKRGRKSKAEFAMFQEQKTNEEAAKGIYEKQIATQLNQSVDTLIEQMPIDPKWGVKCNSQGKNVFWFGYKVHLAVGTKSQYVLSQLLSSGNLNDGKAAIPLLKHIHTQFPNHVIRYGIMDAGYDHEPIYMQLMQMNAHGIIAYNQRREPEMDGFDEHFAPTCVREHSYRYDSYDQTYQTIKYVRPKECATCPLAQDTLCQKVFKIKITSDLRKYCAPARGSVRWKELFKQRSSVERVFAYLKQYFGLNQIRYRSGKRAKFQIDLITLVYNGIKLALDRLNARLNALAA